MSLLTLGLFIAASQYLLAFAGDSNRIRSLNVKCGDNDMLVNIEFNQPFSGIIFSKGYFARNECVYVKAAPSKYSYEFTIPYSTCGTTAGGNGALPAGRRSDGFLRGADEDKNATRTRRDTESVQNTTIGPQGRSLFGGPPMGGMGAGMGAGMGGGMMGFGGPGEFPQQGDPFAGQMQNMDYSGGMGGMGSWGAPGGMMGDPYAGGQQQQSWQPNGPAAGGYAGGVPQQQYGAAFGGAQQINNNQQFAGGNNFNQQQQGAAWTGGNRGNAQAAAFGSANAQSQQSVQSSASSKTQFGTASSIPGSKVSNQQSFSNFDSDAEADEIQSTSTLSKKNGGFGEDQTGGSSRFYENIIIIQYDANIQEVWDVAKALRCEWHDNYHKIVSYKPYQVDALEVVPATFAGDNVGVWMTVQQGKGPYAPEVNGIVRIGEYLTLAIGIQDASKKFDMRVINCFASDGIRPNIQLVDEYGCVTRPKIMSDFAKVTNYGDQASVVSYAYFQAFKFPDAVDVQLECSVEICKQGCAKQCYNKMGLADKSSSSGGMTSKVASGISFGGSRAQGGRTADQAAASASGKSVSVSALASSSSKSAVEENMQSVDKSILNSLEEGKLVKVSSAGGQRPGYGRRKRDTPDEEAQQQNVGIKRRFRVVSPDDLSFLEPNKQNSTVVYANAQRLQDDVCISSTGFVAGIVVLMALLVLTTLSSIVLCVRLRSLDKMGNKVRNMDMVYIKQ